MNQEKTFEGAMTALVTPFVTRNAVSVVDEKALGLFCEKQIASGIDGVIACGTTGESATLSMEERGRVLQVVREAVRGRVPVIAGVGSNSTAQTVALALQAKQLGADALLVVTPYYNKPTQQGLYEHYRAVAKVGMPLFLYNVPSRTGCDLLPETVARLCAFPEVIGIKEASGQIQRTQRILQQTGDRLIVLSGDDAINYPLYCIGARGCISVVSNLFPGSVASCWDAHERGDAAVARKVHQAMLPVADALFLETSPTPVKTALSWRGEMSAEVRLPLCGLSETTATTLQMVLEQSRGLS